MQHPRHQDPGGPRWDNSVTQLGEFPPRLRVGKALGSRPRAHRNRAHPARVNDVPRRGKEGAEGEGERAVARFGQDYVQGGVTPFCPVIFLMGVQEGRSLYPPGRTRAFAPSAGPAWPALAIDVAAGSAPATRISFPWSNPCLAWAEDEAARNDRTAPRACARLGCLSPEAWQCRHVPGVWMRQVAPWLGSLFFCNHERVMRVGALGMAWRLQVRLTGYHRPSLF
jgi:hypothetical protein